jgi:MFS family permease
MVGGLIGAVSIIYSTFPLLVVSAAIVGLSRASAEQSRFAAGEMFPENERARMIGRLIFAGTMGAVGGPLLIVPSGRLMESFGLHPDIGPWAASFLCCALAGLLTFFLLRPDPMVLARAISPANDQKRTELTARPPRPLRALLLLPKVQLAVLAVLVSQTVMVILMVMTPLHMEHNHHGREAISMVIAMHTLGMFGLSPLTGYLIDRFGRIPMLILGALTLASSALLSPVSTDQFVLAVALFLLGLGWNFGYVAGSALLADALQGEERARVQGVNDSVVFFGAGLASLAAGPLFASGGFRAVSLAGLALILPLIALIIWNSRPQVEPESV